MGQVMAEKPTRNQIRQRGRRQARKRARRWLRRRELEARLKCRKENADG